MDVTCAALDVGGYVGEGGGGLVEQTPLEQVYVASKRVDQTSNFNFNLILNISLTPPPPRWKNFRVRKYVTHVQGVCLGRTYM